MRAETEVAPTETEHRLVDILGWLWVATIFLTLVSSGTALLAIVVGIGIAAAAGYFGYKFWCYPELFRRKGP